MSTKNGWASIRAVEITIEPGEGFDTGEAIASIMTSLGWAPPAEAEFNLTANVNTGGPTEPPPVAEERAKDRPSRPGAVRAEPRDE